MFVSHGGWIAFWAFGIGPLTTLAAICIAVVAAQRPQAAFAAPRAEAHRHAA